MAGEEKGKRKGCRRHEYLYLQNYIIKNNNNNNNTLKKKSQSIGLEKGKAEGSIKYGWLGKIKNHRAKTKVDF